MGNGGRRETADRRRVGCVAPIHSLHAVSLRFLSVTSVHSSFGERLRWPHGSAAEPAEPRRPPRVPSPVYCLLPMHDPTQEGTPAFFICDFCRRPWSEDRPMVEGHQGSLICGPCLTVAYAELALNESPSIATGATCTMCLEERKQPAWRSPMFDEAIICLRCVKQSATTLEKDEESGWRRPGQKAGHGR